ncbi:hypothetical protein [Magnetospirillum moscoviense]|uniref:Glycosyltransferase RgtA/B/C/D-like domain-containing protein n=1 Tax=Magnetospirillum moscoviense TaxID=1437059 RepID=A0A178MX17_9PROT|nr:hypothetical protein [Magnetospirillum moscoviense]OAN55073.1 hypothetical protein A6A05_00495 [Magnetospirillum moscoviense]
MMPPKIVVVGLAAIGAGMMLALFAAAAPYVGAGSDDNFVLWRLAGMPRGSLLRLGIEVAAAGGVVALIPMLRRLFQPGGTVALLARPAASGLRKLSSTAPRGWRAINRDWVATVTLLPFGAYILAFMVTVPPGLPWIAPDSMTYIGFSPTRTLLYPALLRALAVLSDDPRVLVLPFLVVGIVATIAFAEATQRAFRNILVSVPAGIGLLFCWSLLEHAGFVLSDYPFYAAYTATLAAALMALRQPRPAWLITVGLLIGVSIAIRPVGIVLLTVPFFLACSHIRQWRRLVLFLALPLAVTLLAQAAANQTVFGFFGLSRFSGYPWAGNTALLMTAETPTRHPELRDEIVAMARPYREEIDATATAQDRYIALINTANPLIGHTGSLAMAYGKRKELVTFGDTSAQVALVGWMNGLSTLNAGLGALPAQTFALSIWQDGFLLGLGREAHMANLGEFATLTALKMRFSWQSVLPWYGIGSDFSSHRQLLPGQADLGMSTAVSEKPRHMIPGVSIGGFNVVVERLQRLSRIVPVPMVILLSSLFGMGATLAYLARFRSVPTVHAAIAMLGATTLLYHLMMCIAQIPIGRFVVVVAAAPAVLLFIPLAGLGWLFSRPARRPGEG